MRFHCGISFSWKSIKKILLPILLGILAYFGFSFIYDNKDLIKNNLKSYLLFTPVYAYENDNTSWNLTMPDYDTQLRSTTCSNDTTMYDSVQNIINSTSTDYYELIVGAPVYDTTNHYVSYIPFYIKWKSSISYYNFRYYAYHGSLDGYITQFRFKYSSSNDRIPFYVLSREHCTDYISESGYQMFKYLTDTGNYSNASGVGSFAYDNYEAPVYASDNYFLGSTISNDLSYNVDNWFYYSSHEYYLTYLNPNNNSYYNKRICITDNNICYEAGDIIPSYYDLHHNNNSNSSYIGYKTSLETFYTSISSNNISNYQLSFSFRVPQSLLGAYQTTDEYINNTMFNYICSGRVDHTNYYSYDSFPCSLTSSYTSTESTINYTFNNFSSSSSLSNYDKIYITIDSNYVDSNINKIIYDFSYSYNLGDFYNTSYKGAIYENFSNLPLNFRVYFSSNNSSQNSILYVRKSSFINYNIKYIGFSNTTQQNNLVIGSSILGSLDSTGSIDFISTQVSNSIDTGIMIYQSDSIIPVPNLDLFFNSGMIVSFNYSSSSDIFYYIDNTGSIVSNNFTNPIYSSDTSSYDISYYIGVVNNFINDLSQDSIEFSTLTQSFYNSLPLFFQSFIFVIFILSCIYFTYLLIKK